MNFRLPVLFSLNALVVIAVTAAPDAGDEPVEFDKVSVNGERVTPFTVPSIDAARATLQLVPGGVEVISAERYLRGRASTLEDTSAGSTQRSANNR